MYRGSLKKCVDQRAYQLNAANYNRLTIISNSASKYYTLLTDDEMASKLRSSWKLHESICLRMSWGELRRFLRQCQLDAFGESPPHD